MPKYRIVLERGNEMLDLGVMYDAKLTFKDHMHAKVKKAYMMLGITKCNFKYLTVLLYNSMVRSQLDYCSSVWSP